MCGWAYLGPPAAMTICAIWSTLQPFLSASICSADPNCTKLILRSLP